MRRARWAARRAVPGALDRRGWGGREEGGAGRLHDGNRLPTRPARRNTTTHKPDNRSRPRRRAGRRGERAYAGREKGGPDENAPPSLLLSAGRGRNDERPANGREVDHEGTVAGSPAGGACLGIRSTTETAHTVAVGVACGRSAETRVVVPVQFPSTSAIFGRHYPIFHSDPRSQKTTPWCPVTEDLRGSSDNAEPPIEPLPEIVANVTCQRRWGRRRFFGGSGDGLYSH